MNVFCHLDHKEGLIAEDGQMLNCKHFQRDIRPSNRHKLYILENQMSEFNETTKWL